jgi:hypothetical protein
MKSIQFVLLKTVIILYFSFSGGLSYSQQSPENNAKTEAVNKVQYIGTENDFLVFDVRFGELPTSGCTLRITDDSGNPIFEELITGNSYVRRYKIARDAMTKISFKAVGKGFLFNQSFIIKIEERFLVTAE